MTGTLRQWWWAGLIMAAVVAAWGCEHSPWRWEQRDKVSYLRGPYNYDFWNRHNESYRFGSTIHFAHGIQHDILETTPLAEHVKWDEWTNGRYVDKSYDKMRLEPHMMYWGPYVFQGAWKLYWSIDWTHMHHEQTYDVLSSPQIAWPDKDPWTVRSVGYYLEMSEWARSPAPLDLTMRRAGTMMKPYFTYFRNYYPKSSNYFFVAHWWHPVIYEAMMIAGNDDEQSVSVQQAQNLLPVALEDRPLRMLLSREMMPRYSRMSPASANIFDNLHMLHGIAYDILAYEGWTMDQKRAELYRVLKAMSYQEGDEQYVRTFPLPHPEMDPRVYYEWMKPVEGSMNEIMFTMLQEMWPLLGPDGSGELPPEVVDQFWKKMTPGLQEGEVEGSLHDAIMAVAPNIKMMPEASEPGVPAQKMIDAMVEAWTSRLPEIPEVEPYPMAEDPVLPPLEKPADGVIAPLDPNDVQQAKRGWCLTW